MYVFVVAFAWMAALCWWDFLRGLRRTEPPYEEPNRMDPTVAVLLGVMNTVLAILALVLAW